jgi:nucleoside-diphosphate-sugar epimerase
MRVVVTGASGFIGSHLVDRLLERGDEVHAWVRRDSSRPMRLPPDVARHEVDLFNLDSVRQAFAACRPVELYHLAAQSLPIVSWQAPRDTFHINIDGTVNVLEAAQATGCTGSLIVFGSSSEYSDQSDSAHPIAEDHPLAGNSPYAVSKVAASRMAILYHRRYGLPVKVVRPFFWIGPRKTGDFCSDVARQLVGLETGALERVSVGNLDVVRDFLDVRDGVEGVLKVAERGAPGEVYNICSGVGTVLRDIVESYRKIARVPLETWTDPALIRPIDEPIRVGSPGKAAKLGWRPRRSMVDALRDIVGYWRERA